MRIASLWMLASAATASAQTTQPTFEVGKGPIVAIDAAHNNTHTHSSAEFRGFVDLLQRDGYRVQPFAKPLTSESLAGVDVFVTSGPGGWTGEGSLTESEVTSLIRWIRGGGSLLLILDHMPAPRHAARLTSALGITKWHDGYVQVDVPDSLPIGNIIFWRSEFFPAAEPSVGRTGPAGGAGYQGADARLAKHPITEGRNADERVRRVVTFVGSAFEPPPGSNALLTMPQRAISFTPPETPGALAVFTPATPRFPVGGWAQGAVGTLGEGRIALFAETGLFSGGPAPDNRMFVLNVMRWLRRLL